MKEERDYSEKKIKEMRRIISLLWEELKREPFPEEIAAEMGIEVEEVGELMPFDVISKEKEESGDFQLRFKMTIKNHELEKVRLEKGWKQSDVAKQLGISVVLYSQIECCRSYPSTDRMNKIAKIFGKSVSSLFPTWLQMFSNRWDKSEKDRIVPINTMSLSNMGLFELTSGEDLEHLGQMAIAKNVLKDALGEKGGLSEREVQVLRHRFFLNENLEQTGRAFGVTRERIRQIEVKALEKLRENEAVRGLDDRTEREKALSYQ